MIVTVTLKDPDRLSDACDEAALESLASVGAISKNERDEIAASRSDEASEIISKRWMEYGEYITVRFDTVNMTAEVVARRP